MPGAKSYAVQRSSDGVNWVTIDEQVSVNHYVDLSPVSVTGYYRLKVTGVNGMNAFSNVIAINVASPISISPNPAKNYLNIIGLSSTRNIKLAVIDLNGNVFINRQLTSSNNSYKLDINLLKPGNYILKIETVNQTITRQFVKE